MTSIRHAHRDVANSPRPRALYLLILSSLAAWSDAARADLAAPAQAAPVQVAQVDFAQVEFDPGFLSSHPGQKVDVTRYGRGNVTSPGVYRVDIHVGSDWIGRYDVPFQATEGTPDAQPCFDARLLKRIGIDFRKLPADLVAELAVEGACRRIGQVVYDASASFDFTEQKLTLSIPQASLARTPRGYVESDQWDSGVPMGMLGYNLNLYGSKHQGSTSEIQGYLGLNGGVNIGNWHFRHTGSYTWSSRGGSQYQNIASYLQRDLPSVSSQLVVGESYTSGELFDATQFRGVQLATDDRMLPDSLRGYAPTVRGIANSNAKVTIRQNGVTIYETTVAPGAFEIDDLYPTGYGGDLNVSVTEADGSVHTFAVPYAAVPLSLRPGIGRYSFTAGALRNQQGTSNPLFAQATYQRGLTNLVTGYGGATVAAGYAAAMVGAALNTSIGAFGADFTHATTSIPGIKRFNGSSLRVSYSKSVLATGTDIALAAYRYSTSGYFNLNDAMLARDTVRSGGRLDDVWRQRNRASLTLGQRLGEKGGQLSVTASTSTYWNRPGSDVNYSLGYNNTFRNISYNLSATRQRGAGGDMSTLYYAGVTIPLGRTRPMMLSTNVTHDSLGRSRVQSALSGSLGEDSNLAYGVNVDHASGSGSASTNGGANVAYRARFAELNASVGASTDYQQGSVGIRGAVVAHPGGVTLSQPLSETFGIVEAPGAAGARIANAAGVRVDSRGYAIVPYLTPYNLNTVEIDPKGISTDVELKETSQQVAPRAGAVPLLKFSTETGRSALIRARRADGKPLPFGATVYDASGKQLGIVGQASRILVRGLEDNGSLTVKWGDNGDSSCRIAYALPVAKADRKSVGFQTITGTCSADPTLAAR